MEELLAQIRAVSRAGLYYAALFPSLALPDICGAMESEAGEASRERYISWFDTYVAPAYKGTLSGEDCWYLRCSLLHQGLAQHPRSSHPRVIFVEPGVKGLFIHNVESDDALTLDVQVFCEDIVTGVEEWLPRARALSHYEIHASRFLRRYPDGLYPHFVGHPVIA